MNGYCPSAAAMEFHCPYPDILRLSVCMISRCWNLVYCLDLVRWLWTRRLV